MQKWGERISVDPEGFVGRGCVPSTLLLFVSTIVDNVAAGVPEDEILHSYPALTKMDIEAALSYAAELAREGTIELPLETKPCSLRSTKICRLSAPSICKLLDMTPRQWLRRLYPV